MLEIIKSIPEGYSEGKYQNKKYGITKTTFNNGNSFKVYAKELQGNDFISLNFYITKNSRYLNPCEMPEQKVVDFLKEVSISV